MANEEVNSTPEQEVADVNAAAAKELEQSQAAEQAATGKETSGESTSPTPKSNEPEKPLSVQELESKWEKRYKDLQREFTPLSQDRAKQSKLVEELQNQIKALNESFAKATEKPFDLGQFKKDFEAKGPQALDTYFQKQLDARIKAEREAHEKTVGELREALTKAQNDTFDLKSAHAVLIRANDEKNFPNFQQLYPRMCELAKDPNTKIDFNKDITEVIDALYSLAKSESSTEAVRIAAEQAKKKAEEEVARESLTTVATGGKTASTSTPDLEKMPLEALEKLAIQMHGVADRE